MVRNAKLPTPAILVPDRVPFPLDPRFLSPAREGRVASERSLPRAVGLACALAVGVFGSALLTRAVLPEAIVATPEPGIVIDLGPNVMPPPPTLAIPKLAPTAVAPPRPDAIPQPVPDQQAPPPVAPSAGGSATGSSEGTGTTQPGDETAPGPGTIEPAAPEHTFRPYEVDQLPEPTLIVKPEYSDMAREAGVEGTVVLQALVATDGRVAEVSVTRSIPLLDALAVEALKKWRFTPALVDKRPVRVWVAVPIRFSLH